MRHLLVFAVLLSLAAYLPAQETYPDTTRWIGQWADEGDLTYTLDAMLVEDEDGWVTGWFEWTMIYSPYLQHWNKVGHSGREYLEGKRHKLTGFYHLAHTRVEQTVDVISGDEYIIQLVNDGTKMLGKNFRPTNYQGSLYALKVPKSDPRIAAAEDIPAPSQPEETLKESPAPAVKKEAPADPPAEEAAPEIVMEEAAPPTPEEPAPDFSDRTVLTKEQVAVGSNRVQIEIWDKSMVDGDIVSLTLNGKLLLHRFQVSDRPKVLQLDLQQGDNLLIMHAENLGRIPPNTAAVSILRDGQTEVYILNSDMGKSEAINIVWD